MQNEPLLENLTNYRMCHAKGLHLGWRLAETHNSQTSDSYISLKTIIDHSKWPVEWWKICLQLIILLDQIWFPQAWRKLILLLGHATQPIFQLQLFPSKTIKQLKYFLEEKPTLFLSVFDIKPKFSDERLQQGRREHTKGRGEKINTLWL